MDVTFLPDIAEGRFTFVFSSPESVLKPKWSDVFLTETWHTRISLIVIDEAHFISGWGEAFRPEYQQLCQLRSFFKAPVSALTATSTMKVKQDIFEVLQLDSKTTDIISKSPNRENIFIYCRKVRSTSKS